jgi:hypothetical protein
MIARCLLIVAIFLATHVLRAHVCHAANDRVDYLTQIKPLLRERCYTCHASLKQRAGLRLDTARLMIRGGDSGAMITPGDASESVLLERVSAVDITERMPPEHEGEPLSVAEVELLRAWIEQGAPAPADEAPEPDPRGHWAFRPIVRPAVPNVDGRRWARNPIDVFVAKAHQEHGLSPQTEAPRIILLRRLYFDLIGIPPTAEEIAAFENDQSPDWYERTVSHLLDDPRHGERWARHWMDIWRYSDWWGLGGVLRYSQKHIWHWRDWIVESLNADAPYDEMVRLMLAADELYPQDPDKLRATGYLARYYFLFNRNQWMEETVEHVSKGFLGLTMNCAKCHDHKYDPIQQTDFYRMRAFFEPYHVRLDVVPGQANLERDGIPRVYDGLLNTPTYRFVRGQEKNPDKSTVIAPGVPEILIFEELKVEPVLLPLEAWKPEIRPWVTDAHLVTTEREIEKANAAVAQAREKLAAAERVEQGDGEIGKGGDGETRRGETTAVVDAKEELEIAELAVVAAKADRECVSRCAAAARAAADKPSEGYSELTETARMAMASAIRAERQALLTKAQHRVAAAELQVRREKDNEENAAEGLEAANKLLEEASEAVDAEIKPTDHYTRLWGAKWTPTRFVYSTKDDPTVEFSPRSTGRRTALASWMTDHRNPLTARVAVNHIWTRHMGEPLVPTVFDFGRNGTRPAHPELVDWLASELIDSGWSMKHLHQLIVNSAGYRMTSSVAGGQASATKDPDNRYWWRRTPMRLESQLVRDAIVAHGGSLDLTMGGPPVEPAQQDDSTRRSLYFYHSNNKRNLFLTTFDEAAVKECYRREQSIVPQQALALANSKLILDAAPQIAQRLSEQCADDSSFIRKTFAVLLGIDASDAEIAASFGALESWRNSTDGAKEDGRARLVWALLNHNDFVTFR